MERPQGTSGNSKGKRFFDLLSGTSRVRIAPGSPKSPFLKQKAANSSLLTKAGAFLFLLVLSANRFRGFVCRLPTFLPDF
jgi:hypothetical protein